ncbi:GNAT family N-acetyltransferase [bacterium]|nr:GNAT family N-acetyltransferase [bacterium]
MKDFLIETARLSIRNMRQSDFNELMKIFCDPKVMASFDSPPFSKEQMQSWLTRNLEHQEKYGYGLFSIILKSSETLIGDCGLEHMELRGEEAIELGYDFRSDYWNQGFATEAALAVRNYAFKVLNLPSLISLIRVGNEASKRVAEKIDMQLIEELSISGILYWKYGIHAKTDPHSQNSIKTR